MQYPEPYRKIGEVESKLLTPTKRRFSLSVLSPEALDSDDLESADISNTDPYRLRSISINVHAVEDEVEETDAMLKSYFTKAVLGGLCNLSAVAKYRELIRKEFYNASGNANLYLQSQPAASASTSSEDEVLNPIFNVATQDSRIN
jgi:hypothetical protein